MRDGAIALRHCGLARRQLLLVALATAAAGWTRAAAADAAAAEQPVAAPPAVEIAAGVYVVPGLRGLPDADNLGRIGNAGFIVGRLGVMAIDCGTSRQHGDALLGAIAQVTPLPVQIALVTHTRQEFLFGASAFQARGIPVVMHKAAAELMAARCETCLKTLRRELGEGPMRGTSMFTPDRTFEESHVIESIGRPVFVQHHGHSSGPGDISIFDVRTRTLFAGGLLDNGRIPDIIDSRLDGWQQALAALRTLRADAVVPGHGRYADAELINTVERYLVRLERRVASLLRSGTALSDVPDASLLPEYAAWDQVDTVHRRNASVLFLRLERRLLIDDPVEGARP